MIWSCERPHLEGWLWAARWSGLETSILLGIFLALELTHLSDTGTLVASGQSSSPDDLLPLEVVLPLDHLQDGVGPQLVLLIIHQAGNSHKLKCRGIDKSRRDTRMQVVTLFQL